MVGLFMITRAILSILLSMLTLVWAEAARAEWIYECAKKSEDICIDDFDKYTACVPNQDYSETCADACWRPGSLIQHTLGDSYDCLMVGEYFVGPFTDVYGHCRIRCKCRVTCMQNND